MNTTESQTLTSAQLRNVIFALILVITVGGLIGRICAIQSRGRVSPMLSANDRSRWCTVWSLVDNRSYIIDEPVNHEMEINGRTRYPWDTIDKVEHLGPDGKQHFYSSKPPLFPTMLAGQYWLLKAVTGYKIADEPYLIMRIMLVLTNVVPLVLYLLIIRSIVERHGLSDWGKVFILAAAAWGTLLTTFAITINNHLPAAISVAIVMSCMLLIWRDPRSAPPWSFACAGFFAAFAAANELPAAAFFGISGLLCLWKNPRKTLLFGVPAAAIVVIGFFATNHFAHKSLRPPYAHRGLGAEVALVEPFELKNETQLPGDVREKLVAAGVELTDPSFMHQSKSGAWALSDKDQYTERFAVVEDGNQFRIHRWDNWYDYPTSYWVEEKRGVDAGEKSRMTYLMHCLVGHHGIFSLTPIWIFSLIGMITIWRSEHHRSLRPLAGISIVVTLIVVTFYIMRPTIDRNYGGVSSGLRWTFWMIPLWIVTVIPVVDRWWQRRWFQMIAFVLLGISVMTVLFPISNPWSQPWLFDLLTYLGWIDYP